MHAAHVSFYQRYIKLLNYELRNHDSNLICSIEIQPTNIIKMCSDLPMWVMLCHNTQERIFIISPTDMLVRKYNQYIKTLVEHISNNNSAIKMTVLSDPDTGVRCLLYL